MLIGVARLKILVAHAAILQVAKQHRLGADSICLKAISQAQ